MHASAFWQELLDFLHVDNVAVLSDGDSLLLCGCLDRVLGSKDLVEFLEL